MLFQDYFNKLYSEFKHIFSFSNIKHLKNYVILTACPKIDHCLEMHCIDTASSTICANCDGVITDLPYHKAYILSKDRKHCQRKFKESKEIHRWVVFTVIILFKCNLMRHLTHVH